MLTKKPSIPLQRIQHPLFQDKGLTLDLLRIDKTDPIISGNKWFKLKYNLIEARHQGLSTLVSFGGPYSNHLHALASAGKANHFNTIGIIRGEPHLPLNPTLSDVKEQDMALYYIDRKTYRSKHLPKVIKSIKQLIAKEDPFNEGDKADQFYLVPEGGTNQLAVKGASEIASFIPHDANFICVPCGTGGTIAGIITGLSLNSSIKIPPQKTILGFPAMKGGHFLQQVIQELINEHLQPTAINHSQVSWKLINDWHFGGFGKINKALALFIQDFEKKCSIELDPIYTAKMMYGIVSMIEDDFFPRGSKIIAVHTGGLQGKRGMEDKINSLLTK